MASYIVSVKHCNTVHCAVAFHRGADRRSIENTLAQFVATLAQHVGCNLNGLTIAGLMIERQEAVIPGMAETVTANHAHLVIKSVKGRKSGKTVARIREHHPAIETAMAGTAFRSMALEPVYDLPGLLGYITGPKNAQAAGARVFTINQIG